MSNSQYSIYGLNNISGGIRRGETMVIGVHTSSKTSMLNQVIDDIILNCGSNNVMSDEEALTQIDKLKKFIALKPVDFVSVTALNLCVQRSDDTDVLISFKKMIESDNSVRVDVIKSRHEVGSDEGAPEIFPPHPGYEPLVLMGPETGE